MDEMTFDNTVSSGRHYRIQGQDFYVVSRRSPLPAHGETALIAAGTSVPADHRVDWASVWGSVGRVVEVWSGASERCVASIVVDVGESTALPGYELWRVERLPALGDRAANEAALLGLADDARSSRRALSIAVGLATDDQDARVGLAEQAHALGYRRAPSMRGYGRTLAIDLAPDEDELFAGLHASCRRGIRAVAKNPIESAPVTDAGLAPRLRSLHEETMGRTGGDCQSPSWAEIIRYAEAHPEVARLVGMYETLGDSGTLLAFALGLRQGDHVEYRLAASARSGVRAPLGYALGWDLIVWAKRIGARWFDFGGIPADPVPENLAGIVRFKQSFGGRPIDFREEWVIEIRPVLETIRRGLARAAKALRGSTG